MMKYSIQLDSKSAGGALTLCADAEEPRVSLFFFKAIQQKHLNDMSESMTAQSPARKH